MRRLYWVGLLLAIASGLWIYSGRESRGPEKTSKSLVASGGVDEETDASTVEEESDEISGEILRLLHPPVSHYRAAEVGAPGTGDYEELATQIDKWSQGRAVLDPALQAAAKEVAVQASVLGESPSQTSISFILRSFGAPEQSVAQFSIWASQRSEKRIQEAIETAIASSKTHQDTLLLGVGEAVASSEKLSWRIVVLVAKREFLLDKVPRQIPLGEDWQVSGDLQGNFSKVQASVLYPDGRLEAFPVELDEGRFVVKVASGDRAGSLHLSLDGNGATGPGKILQLQCEVGRPILSSIELVSPPPEEFETLEDAEQYAFLLLNQDRFSLGIPALVRDGDLDRVARAHSNEMRDMDYFGHLSVETGLAGDRLERAALRTTSHAENLAFNDSVWEAEASLLQSLGHRANIINPKMKQVGIGIAMKTENDESTSYYLTQLFARRVEELSEGKAEELVREAINAARESEGLPPLMWEESWERQLQEGCGLGLEASIENLPTLVAKKIGKLSPGRVGVAVHVVFELDDFDPGESLRDKGFGRFAVATCIDDADIHGRRVVIQAFAE